VIVNVISHAPRDIWDKVLAEDPFALESQLWAWTDALCQSLGYTDASRMYAMSDGRKLVLPLLRRSVAGVSLFEGSNPAHCGVGGILASHGPRSIEVAAVLEDLVARRALVRSFWPHPALARSGLALCRRGLQEARDEPTSSTWMAGGMRFGRIASPRVGGEGCAMPSGVG
jgi:hypothetical protein